MKNWQPFTAVLYLALAAAQTSAQTIPKFTGAAIAAPPAQDQPWKLSGDTKLPADLISATATLFELGMADPRGCEYREVTVVTGNVWGGDGSLSKVHGWLLPEKAGDKQRFAVLWNGLVYPAVNVADKADLKADIERLCKADEDMRAAYAKDNPDREFSRWTRANEEEAIISESSLLPLKASLLLRLSETTLAEKFWSTCMVGTNRHFADKPDDPFVSLADDWFWARYDRAITAHMRGDDQLAALDAKALIGAYKTGVAAAEKRGLTRDRDLGAGFLNFLNPQGSASPDALLADSERRLKENNRQFVLTLGLANFPDQPRRIAALIDDLDQVSARQMGQPGGVSLGEDPIVQALIAEGEAAVDPLLACMEKDGRLTRSVHFWRDFSKDRSVIKVSEAAYVAISGILQQSFFAPAATGDDLSRREDTQRQALVNTIRVFWQKNKGIKPEERWYATLADNSASHAEWLQAATLITRPADVESIPSSMFGAGWIIVPERKPGDKITLRGETLRAKTPDVGDLLAQRLKASYTSQNQNYNQLNESRNFAEALLAWDGKGHRDALDQYTVDLLQRFDNARDMREYLAEMIAVTCGKRMELGDERAFAQYAKWAPTVTPKELGFGVRNVLAPLWRNPARPDMAQLAEKLLNAEGSPWNPIVRADAGGNFQMNELIDTPLIILPAMQKQLLRQLDDQTAAGSVKITSGGGMDISGSSWSFGTSLMELEDPLAPEIGKPVNFRLCDHIAWLLSRFDGFPRIELYWPLAKRDDAIKHTRAVLRQYGPRLSFDVQSRGQSGVGMRFSPLDHPATPDDVVRGAALFSLEGERRLWKLPEAPLQATCETLHQMPAQTTSYDLTTKKTKRYTTWRQQGFIWQAEELQRDGKWERWFGFVAPGFIGKVPASEVTLNPQDSWQWGTLDKGIQWRMEPPDGPKMMRPGSVAMVVLKPRSNIPMKLRVRNVLGVPQEVVEEYTRNNSVVAGVILHVQRLENDAALTSFHDTIQKDGWIDVPLKPFATFEPGKKTPLDVLEELPTSTIDLKTYGVDAPGIYRIWLEKGTSVTQPELLRLSELP